MLLSPLRLPIPPQRLMFFESLRAFAQRLFWRRHPDLNRGIKVLQTLALPLGYSAFSACLAAIKEIKNSTDYFGAGNEIRTRDIHLGKVTLYH